MSEDDRDDSDDDGDSDHRNDDDDSEDDSDIVIRVVNNNQNATLFWSNCHNIHSKHIDAASIHTGYLYNNDCDSSIHRTSSCFR